MTAGLRALAALTARFTNEERCALKVRLTLDVIQEARARRAAALLASHWEETDESRRESPVIVALHAFYLESHR